jgi:hypothetical protein
MTVHMQTAREPWSLTKGAGMVMTLALPRGHADRGGLLQRGRGRVLRPAGRAPRPGRQRGHQLQFLRPPRQRLHAVRPPAHTSTIMAGSLPGSLLLLANRDEPAGSCPALL